MRSIIPERSLPGAQRRGRLPWGGRRLFRLRRGLALTSRAGLAAIVVALVVPAAAMAQRGDSLPPPADTAALLTGPLRAGDQLNLRVYRDSELTGKYLIDAEGNVQIPGLGVVRVAGLTPHGATDRLVEALRERG